MSVLCGTSLATGGLAVAVSMARTASGPAMRTQRQKNQDRGRIIRKTPTMGRKRAARSVVGTNCVLLSDFFDSGKETIQPRSFRAPGPAGRECRGLIERQQRGDDYE